MMRPVRRALSEVNFHVGESPARKPPAAPRVRSLRVESPATIWTPPPGPPERRTRSPRGSAGSYGSPGLRVTPRGHARTTPGTRTPQNLLPTLPVTPDSRESRPDLRRVSCTTVAELLDGRYPDLQAPWIFDCRYGYEYYGGHIRGAHHAPSVEEVSRFVLAEPGSLASTPLIFHCEFSQQRAPAMVKALRLRAAADGVVLPPLYIMKGGYHDFFKERPDLCEPQGYVAMHSAAYTTELAAAARWSPRKGRVKRAKTWSRLGGVEPPDRVAPLWESWDGADDRMRLPFPEDEKDALWHSLELF